MATKQIIEYSQNECKKQNRNKKGGYIFYETFQLRIPCEIPKITQSITLHVVDFLKASLLTPLRLSSIPFFSELLHLFSDQSFIVSNTIISSVSIAEHMLGCYEDTFFSVHEYHENCEQKLDQALDGIYFSIRLLNNCDFNDKNFIMGKLWLAAAVCQRLKIRGARELMCKTANLTKVKKYKVLRPIKWWISPAAEASVMEAVDRAGQYLEHTVLTVDHLRLIILKAGLMDYINAVNFKSIALLSFSQPEPGSERDVNWPFVIKSFIQLCSNILFTNMQGTVPFAVFEISQKDPSKLAEIIYRFLDYVDGQYRFSMRKVVSTAAQMFTSLLYERHTACVALYVIATFINWDLDFIQQEDTDNQTSQFKQIILSYLSRSEQVLGRACCNSTPLNELIQSFSAHFTNNFEIKNILRLTEEFSVDMIALVLRQKHILQTHGLEGNLDRAFTYPTVLMLAGGSQLDHDTLAVLELKVLTFLISHP